MKSPEKVDYRTVNENGERVERQLGPSPETNLRKPKPARGTAFLGSLSPASGDTRNKEEMPTLIQQQTRSPEPQRREISPTRSDAHNYEYVEELASGGMGRVVVVRDRRLRRRIAMKLLKPSDPQQKKFMT